MTLQLIQNNIVHEYLINRTLSFQEMQQRAARKAQGFKSLLVKFFNEDGNPITEYRFSSGRLIAAVLLL